MEMTGLRAARIMLVEDSEGDVYAFKRALREARILNEVDVFATGKDALDHLLRPDNAEGLPGIVFLDINLPLGNGFEVLRKIKTEPHVAHIPVVMLTISQEEEDIIRSYEYGAVSFITKCVRAENLLDILSSVPGFRFVAYTGALEEDRPSSR